MLRAIPGRASSLSSFSSRGAIPHHSLPVNGAPMRHFVKGLCFVLLLSLGVASPWPGGSGFAQEASLQANSSEELKALTLEDYDRWSTIGQVALSADGRWMTFSYSPNDGDSKFFVRDLDNLENEPVELPENGSGPVFSDDSRWLAYVDSPGSGGGRGAGAEQPPRTRALHVRDLATGEETEIENPSSFSFSNDSHWLAVHKSRPGGGGGAAAASGRGGPGSGGRGATGGEAAGDGEGARGADLILLELGTDVMTNIGNVAEVAFNEGSTHLAYVVDAEGRAGNGVHLLELGTARVIPLNTGDYFFQGLTWNEDGTALAILRGENPDGMVQRENVLLTFSGIEGNGSTAGEARPGPRRTPFVYDPSADPSFPAGYVISEFRAPSWSEDGERVFLGIKEQEEEAEEREGSQAEVVVWHWKDERVQSQQEAQAGRDRRATLLSVLNLDGPRFFQLSTDEMEQVQLTADGRWGVGFDDSRYWMDRDHQSNRNDVYRVNPTTGEKSLITEALINSMGTSPDSRWFLYWQDKRVHAFNLESGETNDLTEHAGLIDFENREFDQPVEKPAYGVGGWSNDGDWVFLYTKYDIWRVALDREESWNVTFSSGDWEEVRYRIMDLNPEDEGLDLSEPLLLQAYGEKTKKSGYFVSRPDGGPDPLLWEDAMVGTPGGRGGGLRKATESERVIFTRQTFEDFPDYWVSDTRFRNPQKVTEANPQQAEYLWGRRVLVDYADKRGNKLQATLALPADYVEGRRYPMIMYFYEKMSQRHHEYSQPTFDDRPHMSTYASNGYLVLMPDIVYDMGYPGSSALDDVVSAAQATIDAGFADPDRICLQGHSWGGYETSFIVTQTDMFACVVTGAPLTNLVSMHNILYKSSGNPNASIIQWGQGRMDTTPFHDLERYIAESPVHHVENINTPFLILQGTEDGSVDWNQGLEFYIAARRMGKEVIFLSYPGEPHHLGRVENQKDFQIRMRQYFDHYLKDAPAPRWMTDGVPFLEKDRVGPLEGVGGRGG
jgi:dipeptidyl aminopeptidase/acylaminoacyl peptidase